jgi:hypothetical protein
MEAKRRPQSAPESFRFALRVRHPSIDPEEISNELRLAAEHSFKAGQPRPSGSRSGATSVYNESYWLAPLDPAAWAGEWSLIEGLPNLRARGAARAISSLNPEVALTLVTTALSHTHAAFLRRLQAEGGEVRLLVELSADAMSGFTLTPTVSRTLGSLGVSVNFEFANT